MSLEEELSKLRVEVERHNKLYHQHDNPEISDAEYDALYLRLKELESLTKSLDSSSPTAKVGAKPRRSFEKHKHLKPMLSLSNVFNDEEFRKFEDRVTKWTSQKNIEYSIEPKFDGIGISITYENGKLTKAVTRGDGAEGELVTENVRQISKIPHEIEFDAPNIVELRGEIFFRLNDFNRLNQKLEKERKKIYKSKKCCSRNPEKFR